MSSDIAIKVEGLSKCYQIYGQPRDRLKQFILPRVQRLLVQAPCQYYREFWALNDVSFELPKGESVGILGRNGSGKSTLLQLITGTLEPTSGSVIANGRISALLELGAGFNPEFTGRENVFLNLALHGFSDEAIRAKFDDVASFADIGDFIEQPVKTYSSGMYARLAFSAAIHTEPDVLIVDEILAVGDTYFQQKCINRLYRMLDDGLSVLLVSHDAYQVRSICKHALLLQRGEQLLFDSSEKVMDAYTSSISKPAVQTILRSEPQEVAQHEPIAVEAEQPTPAFWISIHDPVLISNGVRGTVAIKSLSSVELEFEYQLQGELDEKLSFVVNLYHEDGTYIFGTTTKMQGLDGFEPGRRGRVRAYFPSLPLVSGKYKFRVAVNDARGLSILAEATPVCHVTVADDFRAVGLVDIPHSWAYEILTPHTRKMLADTNPENTG